MPKHKGLAGDWETLVYRTAKGGSKRVVRAIYELRTLEALCDQLRCKGIWVQGAAEFRNPDADLQPDFVERRGEHYAALAKPLDPREFIDAVRAEHERELAARHTALPDLDLLTIAARGRDGSIRLSPLDAVAEPRNLGVAQADERRRVQPGHRLKRTAPRTQAVQRLRPCRAGDLGPAGDRPADLGAPGVVQKQHRDLHARAVQPAQRDLLLELPDGLDRGPRRALLPEQRLRGGAQQGIGNISVSAGYQANSAALFAALALSILPMIIVYAFFQRRIQSGLTAGATK